MTDYVRSYRPRLLRPIRGGIVFALIGLILLLAAIGAAHKSPTGADANAVWSFVLGFASLGFAAIFFFGAMRGLPRLTVTRTGVRLETMFGLLAASWESLSLFEVTPLTWSRRGRAIQSATASIVGPQVSRRLRRKKQFVIPDTFQTPIADIVAGLNAQRVAVVGPTFLPLQRSVLDFGVANFTLPWLTLSLLGILIALFAAEVAFPVGKGATPMQPSLATLIAFGGINRNVILTTGEWNRLITGPFLHVNLMHIMSNGIGLLLAGWILERLIGRVWFLALFMIGALGGSLMSLAVNPGNLTSVGASGAIMAMFAALYVLSFRLPPGPLRTHAQARSVQILVPSLLPLAATAAGATQIDYGAHAGGALAGAGVGLLLLRTWPDTSRLPRFPQAARAIAAIGILFAGIGGAAVAARYADYKLLAVMIPLDQLPRTAAEISQRGASLATRYPDDPRAHAFAGIAALVAHDYQRSEQEMQTALQQSPRFRILLGQQFENSASILLAAAFQADGQHQQAKDAARLACRALPTGQLLPALATLLSQQHLCE
jgi:membrane associated rhomboid family serine protease